MHVHSCSICLIAWELSGSLPLSPPCFEILFFFGRPKMTLNYFQADPGVRCMLCTPCWHPVARFGGLCLEFVALGCKPKCLRSFVGGHVCWGLIVPCPSRPPKSFQESFELCGGAAGAIRTASPLPPTSGGTPRQVRTTTKNTPAQGEHIRLSWARLWTGKSSPAPW